MTVRQYLLPYDDTGDIGHTMSMQINCIGPSSAVKVPNCVSSGLVLKYAFTAVLAMEKYFFLHIWPIVTSLQCIIHSP